MTNNRTEIAIAAGLGVAASLLYDYEAYFLSRYPDHWSFVWPMLPYVMCWVVVVQPSLR